GGDQAVIKEGENIRYFGGKSKQVEKNTRVKARVKAHALRELFENNDKVIIMGHKIGDADSFGSAIGIYRAAKSMGKKSHIVVNEITTSVRPMIEGFINNPEYEADMFLNVNEAVNAVDDATVVVVVDVNRPSYTECPELLKLSQSIVVLDHHRQSSEIIENAVLSYIEPYASSASEMVAEILQYIGDNIKMRPAEADAMYAGIVIDTNNFVDKTGVRTFEAAAFLRRNGADVSRVRKMFRDDVNEYKARAEIVQNAEVFSEHFVISECNSEKLESPTVVAAQAANELLNINGVKASFVLTMFNNTVYISARSIDEVNVQIIMEQLGGGGHMSIAGAQLTGVTVEEGKQLLKEIVNRMLEEGDI
ncbi:MAG: DHH family phosphoesterase, partial [Lachnospiraceae bacterium]|nr:DHH family phosphoesterase [Lachnospiraceae bacterium]